MIWAVFRGVWYFCITLGVVLLLMRGCVAVSQAQEIEVRQNDWNHTLLLNGWPTRSNGSETLAHYGYVYDPYAGADIIHSEQDFTDFQRAICEETNSFWLGQAEKAYNNSRRTEALGYVHECYTLYPPAWE